MKIYGIIGWKNSGKTSLIERLVANITARGFTVSTVKHVHHDVDLDQPGKDSFRHRAAGASEVVLASAHRFALMREHRGAEPELPEILARMAPVDLILVEGYKRDAHAKIEVFRAEAGHDLIQPGDPLVRAVATDCDLGAVGVPCLDLNDTDAITDFILAGVGLRARSGQFDRVVIVDWSAANQPTSAVNRSDAIWIGIADHSGTAEYHFRTRTSAETFLQQLVSAAKTKGQRLLIGFDFAFGYPEGFAKQLTGTPSARAVWAWLDQHIIDTPANANNRFEVANQINAGFGANGPFWSHPAGRTYPALQPTKHGIDHARLGFAEYRQVEKRAKGAKSVWMLNNPGAVASQSLVGLPMIHRLSQDPAVAVWPFDPANRQIVLAEVYPSLLSSAVKDEVANSGCVKDQAQVNVLAKALFNLGRQGLLDSLLQTKGGAVVTEEGWILGADHAAALLAAL